MRSLYRGRRWRVLQLALLPGSSAREAKPNAVQCDPGPPTDGSLLAGTTRSARALDLALVAPLPSSGSACARSRGARHRGGRRVTLFSSSSRFVANNVVHGVWDRRVYVGPSGPAPRCRHPNGFAAGHTASTLPFAIYVSVSALRRDAVPPAVCSDARRSGPLPVAATAVTGVPVLGDPDILVADPRQLIFLVVETIEPKSS